MSEDMNLSSVRLVTNPKEIGKLIDAIRYQFAYTHREMCVLLGVSEETYYRWRRTGNYASVFVLQTVSCADPSAHAPQEAAV